jgi:hypothetical protein
MNVKTVGDLLNGHEHADIRCLYSHNVVRRLSLDPHKNIVLDALQGPTLVIPPTTELLFEPWEMDRGSILFYHNDFPGKALKLCGEMDTIHYDDGTQDSILPAPDLQRHPHFVQVNVF